MGNICHAAQDHSVLYPVACIPAERREEVCGRRKESHVSALHSPVSQEVYAVLMGDTAREEASPAAQKYLQGLEQSIANERRRSTSLNS
ncbi:MAG: hypothetical protein KC680_00215 [Candidatus Peregrinibacteria bacterium]|nr:hypothetical protein [Candidatus Peregrinibacteria bacterium]MCB9807948.1 hypothetical protein [Candidatus Peribacteria bacterium]